MYVIIPLKYKVFLSIYLFIRTLQRIPQSLEEEGIFTFFTYNLSDFTLIYIASKIKNKIKKLNSTT